jgi:hypothetical protein
MQVATVFQFSASNASVQALFSAELKGSKQCALLPLFNGKATASLGERFRARAQDGGLVICHVQWALSIPCISMQSPGLFRAQCSHIEESIKQHICFDCMLCLCDSIQFASPCNLVPIKETRQLPCSNLLLF